MCVKVKGQEERNHIFHLGSSNQKLFPQLKAMDQGKCSNYHKACDNYVFKDPVWYDSWMLTPIMWCYVLLNNYDHAYKLCLHGEILVALS